MSLSVHSIERMESPYPDVVNAQIIHSEISKDEAILRKTVMERETSSGGRGKIIYLKIASNYALVGIADDYTGGMSLYQKSNGTWKVLAESGGAFTVNDLKSLGIPSSIAKQLIPKDDSN